MAEKAKQQQQRFAFSFPVTVVVSAIAYIYISTVFVFIDRWLGLFSSPGIANAVVFTFIAFMSVFSYRSAVFMDPGQVPSTYSPDVEDTQTPIHEIKRKVTTLQHCNKIKLILHFFNSILFLSLFACSLCHFILIFFSCKIQTMEYYYCCYYLIN